MQMRILGVALALATTTASAESRIERPDDYHAVGNRAHQGIPSHEISRVNGRRWAVWYASPMPDEDSNSYLVLATSDGPNAPWREVGVVDPDRDGPVRAFDPEMWIAPDGKLRLIWTERAVTPFLAVGKPFELSIARNDRLMMLELSAEDEPAVPSAEARQIGRGVMMCKPIVLPSGTWQLPVANWGEAPSANFLFSKDGGKTFEPARDLICTGTIMGITIPEHERLYDEHIAVAFPDGARKCWIRTKTGVRVATSPAARNAEAFTWTDPVSRKDFRHTSSRLWIGTLRSGNLVCVKHGAPDKDVGRSRLTAFVSKDRGETWQGGLLLDERQGVSYPDGVVLDDGTVSVIYDYNRRSDRNVLIARFTEEDVLAGTNVSGKVALREVVSAFRPLDGLKLEKGQTLGTDGVTVWTDAKQIGIEGYGWMGRPGTDDYTRLPRAAKGRTTARVWGWSREPTGMSVRFLTEGKGSFPLKFRWGIRDNPTAVDPQTCGRIDVYGRKKGCAWEFVRTFAPGTMPVAEAAMSWSSEWECRVYLPAHVNLASFQVGLGRTAKLVKPAPLPFAEKPIVHYGTSIVHGGCVQRPGMIYTSIYSRLLDAEVVNLGFSGSAEMEPEMIDYVAGVDASLYILDPLPNMWPEIIEERYEKFVRGVNAKRPDAPILLCSAYRSGRPGEDTRDGLWVKALWEKLRKEDPAKWAKLHYLPAKDMLPPDSTEATQDRTHPNEYGAIWLGRCYAAKIREILGDKGKGTSSKR